MIKRIEKEFYESHPFWVKFLPKRYLNLLIVRWFCQIGIKIDIQCCDNDLYDFGVQDPILDKVYSGPYSKFNSYDLAVEQSILKASMLYKPIGITGGVPKMRNPPPPPFTGDNTIIKPDATIPKSMIMPPPAAKAKHILTYYEDIDVLRTELEIGVEYLFSDDIEVKKDKWHRGVLQDIKRHPYSANCFVCDDRFYLYVQVVLS